MRSLACYTLGISVSVALLAGCGGPQPPIGTPGLPPQSRAASTQRAHDGSWMLASAAGTKELAYLTDNKGFVAVYAYPSGAPAGKLKGFWYPRGACVDAIGDVYIADSGNARVVEYAHGGKSSIKVLSAGGTPYACSVAPDGDLAVLNINTPRGPSDIAVFYHASGSPKDFFSKPCTGAAGLGYDSASNLYIQNGYNVVCEIKHDGASIKVVKSNAVVHNPVGVMWDGKHITLADDHTYGNGSVTETVIHQMKESKFGDLTEVGKTALTTKSCSGINELYLPFILGATNTPRNNQLATLLVGANSRCSTSLSTWSYPAGGNPVKVFKTSSDLISQVVSIAE